MIGKRENRIVLAIAAALMMWCVPNMSAAGPLMLKAKLDSTQLLMGKTTMMHLELVTDKGRDGVFPIFTQPGVGDGIVSTCGDSVELHYPTQIDTLDLGSNRLQVTYMIPVQAFDSGLYRIPPIEYISGPDTALSNTLTLKVVPLSGLTADSEPAPMAGVAPPEPGSWTDKIPDAIYYNWYWILIALIAIAAVIWLIIKHKKGSLKDMLKRPEKPLPAWEKALQQLDNLKKRKLFEQGMEREYYTELTEILRVYLEERFGIRALEMTSQEILDTLAKQGEDGKRRDYVRKILDMADFVKFAKMRPLPDEAQESMDYARKFVEETIPQPAEEEKNSIGKEGKQ